MGRTRSGSIWLNGGDIYARVTYTDQNGKRKDIKRKAVSRTHARSLAKEMIAELEQRGDQALNSARMTFAQLALHYIDHYLVPPQYVHGRKVRGLRSYKENQRIARMLSAHFGKKLVREITHGDLLRFKTRRLDTPVRGDEQRSIATVNRELTVLQRMFTVAFREGWVSRHPFTAGGETLISSSDERRRERILSRDEEIRLLDACDGRRVHLKPIVICALDTGMRRGEIFKLRWKDLDLKNRVITIQAFNTKTMRERTVRMTARLTRTLEELWSESRQEPNARVFGIEDTIKRSWATALQIAGIEGVRFHDLRHTCATRLVKGRLELAEVSRVLGHTNITTTFRYANLDETALDRAASILDEYDT
jgi:integrase